jgi:hypothetical protein
MLAPNHIQLGQTICDPKSEANGRMLIHLESCRYEAELFVMFMFG